MAKPKPEKHAFLVKTGTVFTGHIERETKTEVVLDVGKRKRAVVTLDKSYIVAKDGQPFPPKRKVAPRGRNIPLVITDERDYSTSRNVVLFFDAPPSAATRARLTGLVPPPLRFCLEWATPSILFAGTYEFFELDVRIAYNAKARALLDTKKIAPFADGRIDTLFAAGIDNEPSAAEMRAFAKDVVTLIDAAHATRHLAVAYVNNLDSPALPALNRAAKAYGEEARLAAVAMLRKTWDAKDSGRKERSLLHGLSYFVLVAIAQEYLSLTAAEHEALATLFDRVASRIKLDPTWRELRAKLVPTAKTRTRLRP